jgi:hypothetical protein
MTKMPPGRADAAAGLAGVFVGLLVGVGLVYARFKQL